MRGTGFISVEEPDSLTHRMSARRRPQIPESNCSPGSVLVYCSNKKLVETSATLVVTGAVTRSY